MMAARSRNPDSVKALLKAGADVNSETDEDYNFITALTMAVYQGHEKCAELLITAGARLEANPLEVILQYLKQHQPAELTVLNC